MPRIGEISTGQIDAKIAAHKADPSAHHDEYTDAEASAIAAAVVAAHAALPTVHQDAPALIATHKADASAHHDEYTDAEAQAIADARIAVHAALATVHQDAPALIAVHAAIAAAHHTRYTNAEALAAAIAGGLSKVIWKAVPSVAMTDPPRTVTLNWTDLDLTTHTSETAKLALLLIRFRATVIGTNSYSELEVRKNGTAATSTARLRIDKAGITAGTDQYLDVVVGLDSGQVLEYRIDVGIGWTVDSRLYVLGYIE